MAHCIARIFEPLWRLLFPASGRHRAAASSPAALPTGPPTGCLPRVPELRGEDIGPRWSHGAEVTAR
ncbi:hypothetical protein ACFWZ2_39750 [Streptomyces sp. NPDC059002]|uniref:hypothetical protein n=1 Tax=Streptomyces sp. NPDC059002 TaxID=3346690 RepID=UPI00369133F8